MGKFAKLQFIIGAKTAGLKRDLNKAEGMFGKLKTVVTSLGGIMAAAFAVAGITRFVKKTAELADIQLKAEASLLAALGDREDVQQRLIKQEQDLQKITLYGDEETIAAQSYLAQMGLEEQAITRLIPLIQDMATAKGMKLTQAADLVAKSVGSSTNALSRYGITIEGAVGSSDRLNSAVEGLTKQFEGQAAVAAKTGLGPLQQLQNAWGDIKEEVGKKLIPILAKAATWLADSLPKAFDFMRKAIKTGKIAINGFTTAVKGALTYGKALALAISDPKNAGIHFTIAKTRVDALGKEFDEFKRKLEAPTSASVTQVFSYSPTGGGGLPDPKTKTKTVKTEDPLTKQLKERAKHVEWLELREKNLTTAINARAKAEEYSISTGSQLSDTDKKREESAKDYTMALAGINAMTAMFNDLSQIAQMQEEDRAQAFKNSIRGIISGLIAEGVAHAIKNQLANPATGMVPGLGIALAAAAGAGASALFNTLVPKMATGGIVPPGFANDTYPAFLSSGETVIPKPKSLGDGIGSMQLHSTIYGEDLHLSSSRTAYRYSRIRGNG